MNSNSYSDENIETILERRGGPTRPPNRIGTLKHDFSHLFLPVLTDLQGWNESDFDPEYAKEIADVYSCERIDNLLANARQIVYGDDGVRGILENRNMNNVSAYDRLRELLPPEDKVHHSWKVLYALGANDLDKARRLAKEQRAFDKWFQEVDKQLHELRSILKNE